MNGALLLIGSAIILAIAYFLYGGLLSKVLGIDGQRKTPAHDLRDDIDYVPTHPAVLFGHHFASIAGAGPIVGPILAGYFGWGSVILWVLVGGIFIGAMHDMVSLYLSVRHKGQSIATVIETVLGKPGRLLFLLFCWSTLILVCAEFVRQVAATFIPHPEVASSSLLFIGLALIFGCVVYRLKLNLIAATAIFVPIMFFFVHLGEVIPLDLTKLFNLDKSQAQTAWTLILLGYCFLASTLPVWLLLQPRDYLNSYLLYAMIFLGFIGVFVAMPHISMEPFTSLTPKSAAGHELPLFPILFITVACGACSGFHSLVASGTTAKQIDNERHIQPVAYGGMLLESILAVLALIAVGTMTCGGLTEAIKSGQTPVALFSKGLAGFCTKLGLPEQSAFTFMCLSVSAFLLTSVDTATRLARFTWQELFSMIPQKAENRKTGIVVKLLGNMYVATGLVIGLVALLLLGNPEAAKNLWTIFASANQLLAGLTLFTASLWLYKNHMAYWVTLMPMLFMLAVSSTGLYMLSTGAWKSGNTTLGTVTAILLVLAAILVVLAIIRFTQARKER